MSDNSVEERGGTATGAKTLYARAAAAESRALRGLGVAIDDFFLPEAGRLDERTRAALGDLLGTIIATVEGEIRDHSARLLGDQGETSLAAVVGEPVSARGRLTRSGVLRDRQLMGELLARLRHEALGASLPMQAPDDPERPSLISRFVQDPDRSLAASAMAVLIAENRRRSGPESGQVPKSELPAELHHKLVWWVVAAQRGRVAEVLGEASIALDKALCDAALRALANYDEGDRLEAAAMRFAATIDAQPRELAELLVESLGDRKIVLFTALLAHALGVEYDLAREAVLDSAADRLWLWLRALDLPREAIAQIGYALSEADPRRDLEHFADQLDFIVAIPASEAREVLEPLTLHPDYRAALQALEVAG